MFGGRHRGAEATVSKVVTDSSLDAVVAPSGELPVIFEYFAAEINGSWKLFQTLCGPRFFCAWHFVMIAERSRVRRSSGNSYSCESR